LMTASQHPKEDKEVLYTQGQMNDSSEQTCCCIQEMNNVKVGVKKVGDK